MRHWLILQTFAGNKCAEETTYFPDSSRRQQECGDRNITAERLRQLMSDDGDAPHLTDPRKTHRKAELNEAMFGSSSTPSSHEQSDHSASRLTLAFSIDPGTSTYAASFRLIRPGVRPRCQDVKQIIFPARETTGKMVAAYHEDKFYFDEDLQREINAGEIDPAEVIHLPKVLLYDDHLDTAEAQEVDRLLKAADKLLEDLWTDRFKSIWFKVMDYVHTHSFGKSSEYVFWKQQVFISVPKTVTYQKTALLARAAKRASLPPIQFVWEPLCAAAYNLQSLIENNDIFTSVSLLGLSSW